MLVDEPTNVAYFGSAKSTTAGQSNRIEPELGNTAVPLGVNVGRLATVARAEEEPIWPNFEDGRRRLAKIGGSPR
jgi:hypothetical protein